MKQNPALLKHRDAVVALQEGNHPSGLVLPALIAGAGERASWRFREFFTVNIRNKNTRAAYGQAAGAVPALVRGSGHLAHRGLQPIHVAGYIEELGKVRKAPTVKQHLACIRMLFDWLVTGQVVPSNPAHAVRGPRHSVRKGSTTVMSSEDTSAFLKTIDTSHVVGLRDRALRRDGLQLRPRLGGRGAEGGGLFSAEKTLVAAPA